MDIGDWIIFRDMGAYTMAAASCFNGMPKPHCCYILSEQDWYVTHTHACAHAHTHKHTHRHRHTRTHTHTHTHTHTRDPTSSTDCFTVFVAGLRNL